LATQVVCGFSMKDCRSLWLHLLNILGNTELRAGVSLSGKSHLPPLFPPASPQTPHLRLPAMMQPPLIDDTGQ
jgi:hypothetical protein